MSTHRRARDMQGFTMIELVMTLGIFIVMITALYTFFISSNSTFLYQQAYINTNYSASSVINAVDDAATPADQVLAAHNFTIGTYTSSSTALVLEVPSIDSSNNIVSGKFDYIVFYVSGANVYENTQADAASARHSGKKLLTNALSSITFTYDNADFAQVTYVNVDIQTQSSVKTNVIQEHLHQVIYLRNKT